MTVLCSFALALTACATVPRTVDVSPTAFLDYDHDLFVGAEVAFVEEILAERPEVFNDLLERMQGASVFLESAETVFVSIGTSAGAPPEYRLVLAGRFPVGRARVAALVSGRIRRPHEPGGWYLVDDGRLAFGFPARTVMVATNESEPMRGDRPVAGSDVAPLLPSALDAPTVFAAVVLDGDLVGLFLEDRKIPPKIARQVAPDSLRVELARAGDGYTLAADLVAAQTLQAKLIAVAVEFILRAGDSAGVVVREGSVVRVSEVVVTREQLSEIVANAAGAGGGGE